MASANTQIKCYNCERVFDSMNPTEFRSFKYCNSWFCSVCQHSEDDEDTFILNSLPFLFYIAIGINDL